MKTSLMSAFLATVLLAIPCAAAPGSAQATNSSADIPLTTDSDAARRAFRGGLENIENQQVERAHIDFRSAIRADSNFALAHLFLAYDNGDPAEEKSELDKARELAANASKPEQLMVQWLAGSREGEMVPAISAMNDLVAQFPEDKFLLFIAGRWMVQQHNYENAQRLLERAVAVDPNYPAALNELGYAYAGSHQFDRAFKALDKYIALLPGEPNTEDSYGEISRMSGRYDQALAHFQKALSYDSKFIWSQVGVADTYLLMGKEEQARIEYAKAIAAAPSDGDRLNWEMSSAMTYAYQNDAKAFFPAMQAVADEAAAIHIGMQQAMAYRLMAMYARDPQSALEYARKGEAVVARKGEMTASDSEQQLVQLRRTEAIRAAMAGDTVTADRLADELRAQSARSNSEYVQMCSEGGQGGVLWAEKKFTDAIPHLEEDQGNPLSAARLVLAYRGAGDNYSADELLQKLSAYHEPTLDDLLARRLLSEQGTRK